jgi:drug/metabolite transporter (DMT)-like permease
MIGSDRRRHAVGHRARAAATAWQTRFTLLALIWGSSFLLIKQALASFAPVQISFGRLVIGLVLLLGVMAVRREGLPREPIVWLHLAVAGLVLNALPFSLLSYSETQIPSLLAGIVSAAAPLVTVSVAFLLVPDERLDRRRLGGLAIGLVGVLVMLGVWQFTGGGSVSGRLAAVAATVSYGFGYPYVRRFLAGRAITVTALAAGQLLCAVVELAPFVPHTVPHPATPSALLALAALGVAGSGIAYLLSYSLVRERGATVTSAVNYPIPAIAVAEGVILLGEPLSWFEPVGAILVLVGVFLVSRTPVAARRRAGRPDHATR